MKGENTLQALARLQGREVDRFDPRRTKKRQAQADGIIVYAQRVKDWPLLEKAVEQKIEEQREFVEWWEKSVTPNRSPDRNNRSVISVADAEKTSGISAMQVSRWRRRLREPDEYAAFLRGAIWSKAMAETEKNIASKWTGDPEWYTPEIYVEAARRVMGAIDLDPASNKHAQQTVKAARWYGIVTDGLTQEWNGRVFLNPPYSFPAVSLFIDKLCAGVESGDITAAVLLTNNNTDTAWWHRAARLAAGVCFTEGRIQFYKEDGSRSQPTNGQTFFYFGGSCEIFAAEFSGFGLIMRC